MATFPLSSIIISQMEEVVIKSKIFFDLDDNDLNSVEFSKLQRTKSNSSNGNKL